MGKSNSKSEVAHNADPQIRIVNTQEYHSALLEYHEMIIIIVGVVVVTQLMLTLYTMLKRRERKRALRMTKSLENIADV